MSFDKLFKRSGPLVLSDGERRAASVLIVEPEAAVRNSMRQTLAGLGIGHTADAPDHLQALKKFEERHFTHVIFEAKKTNMPSKEFLTKILELASGTVAVPSSWDPNVDDVFGLLISGAKGYLVKPFTEGSLDDALVMATKGEAISEAVLYAKDRNEALASLMMTALDKVATALRQSQQFETARREVPRRMSGFKRAVDIGKTFANGGPIPLIEALVELCLERSNGPASKLGRLRKRLEAKKGTPAAQEHVQSTPVEEDAQEELPSTNAPTERITHQ